MGYTLRGPGLRWWRNLLSIQFGGENALRSGGPEQVEIPSSVQPVLVVNSLRDNPFPTEDQRVDVQVFNPEVGGVEVPLKVDVVAGGLPQSQRILTLTRTRAFTLTAGRTPQIDSYSTLPAAPWIAGVEPMAELLDASCYWEDGNGNPLTTIGEPVSISTVTWMKSGGATSVTSPSLPEALLSVSRISNDQVQFDEYEPSHPFPMYIGPARPPNLTSAYLQHRTTVLKTDTVESNIRLLYSINLRLKAWNTGAVDYPYNRDTPTSPVSWTT